jgi:hypothetical protein
MKITILLFQMESIEELFLASEVEMRVLSRAKHGIHQDDVMHKERLA